MKFRLSVGALAVFALASSAQAAGFINGGFEDGNTNGWTLGGGYRGSMLNNNANFNPAYFLPGGGGYNAGIANSHSAVIGTGYVDPNVGAALGSTVYSGNYAMRIEDTTWGGYASVLTQTVSNYTDDSIYFAWKAVMLGAHGLNDAATMVITLTDLTAGDEVIRREYNAASGGGGVDSRFSLLNNNYYTPDWQIEQLSIDASRSGHDFVLSVLAADCQPTGHWGYVYLDGFGAVTPPPGDVPEPAGLALAGLALAAAAAARRRKQRG